MAAPWPNATVQDSRLERRVAHRVRPSPSGHPNKRRDLVSLGRDPPRKDRNRLAHALNGNSAAHGAGRKVVVPKLVDEAEDTTEVTSLATANSSQSLPEDADDDVVAAMGSLVQMLGMERAEAMSLCAFSKPSTIGASQVGAVSVESVLLFPAVCFVCQKFVVSHLTSRWLALWVRGEL